MSHLHHTLHLRQGQTCGVFAEAGLQLIAQRGSVTVSTAPRWLAGTVWRSQVVIPTGQVHAVDAAGWIGLSTADARAELLCVQTQPDHVPITPIHVIHALRALARRAFA